MRLRNPAGKCKKTCPCGVELPESKLGKQRYCLKCKAEKQREYRQYDASVKMQMIEYLTKMANHQMGLSDYESLKLFLKIVTKNTTNNESYQ
jgi:hypothetical protein